MHIAIPLPNPICPLCGKPNDCAPARNGHFDSSCWCNHVMIPAEALARIPDSKHDACICRTCAASALLCPDGWPRPPGGTGDN